MSGTQGTKAIHLRALIQNQVLSVLLDYGSSHTFFNISMVSQLHLLPQAAKPLKVKVANGQLVQTDTQVLGLKLWLQGHTFCTDARVLGLGAYDLILGMDWLERHIPMQCDWLNKRINFVHDDKMQGVLSQQVD
jgi:hypothetical protein